VLSCGVGFLFKQVYISLLYAFLFFISFNAFKQIVFDGISFNISQ